MSNTAEKTIEDVVKLFNDNPEYKKAFCDHFDDQVMREFLRAVATSHEGSSDTKALIQAATIQTFVLDVFK